MSSSVVLLALILALSLNFVSSAHLHSDALKADSPWENDGPRNIETFDGFISYRRSTSRHLAMLIKVMLGARNVSGYLDVEDLEGGDWDNQLMDNISISPNFILILSNGTLERSKNDFNYTDFLHKEIKSAVDLGKRIVPVFDDFDWPPSELFSPEINEALTNQGVTWEHHLVDQSLDRLISYMDMIAPKPHPLSPVEEGDMDETPIQINPPSP